MIDFPVLYANQERCAKIIKNGVIRDAKGSIILPMITLKRNSLAMGFAIDFILFSKIFINSMLFLDFNRA